MNKAFLLRLAAIVSMLFFAGTATHAQLVRPLPQMWLFKVDPASGLVHELRVVFEFRWTKTRFWYFNPAGHYQTTLKQANGHFAQRHYGTVLRGGVRQYFFTDKAPDGFYFQAGASYRFRVVSFLNDQLTKDGLMFMNSFGANAAVGYQVLLGPKDNIAIGGLLGVEYLFNIYSNGYGPADIATNWYQIPFIRELRPYIGLEVGFAIRQKNLHW